MPACPHTGVNAAMQLLTFLAECDMAADLAAYLQSIVPSRWHGGLMEVRWVSLIRMMSLAALPSTPGCSVSQTTRSVCPVMFGFR